MLKVIKRMIMPIALCAAVLLSSAACTKGNTSSAAKKTVPENLTVDISGNDGSVLLAEFAPLAEN